MEKFRLQARRFSACVECCAIFSHGSRKSIPSAVPNTSRPSQVVPPKVVDLNEHDDAREEREREGSGAKLAEGHRRRRRAHAC